MLSTHLADFASLWLTIKLAAISSGLLLLIGTPLSWWLASTKSKIKFWIESLVALPLVLPPTVLGFYLLILFSPNYGFGQLISNLGLPQLAFSFEGLVIGSMIYSLPFVVQPLENSFKQLGNEPIELAQMLQIPVWQRFVKIYIPLAKNGFMTAAVLSFAHTLGEFGVVLMLGGNIPESTRVVSIAIYEHVESLEFAQAHQLSAILLCLSFVILLLLYKFNYRTNILHSNP